MIASDVSDVFFTRNPFPFMRQLEQRENKTLFLAPDASSVGANGWSARVMQRCFRIPRRFVAQKKAEPLVNSGVIGGRAGRVRALFECMTRVLKDITKGNGFCDMAVLQYCVYFDEKKGQEVVTVDWMLLLRVKFSRLFFSHDMHYFLRRKSVYPCPTRTVRQQRVSLTP